MRCTIAAAALLLVSPPCHGWTIESPISHGCHEMWAQEALDAAGYAWDPPPLAGEDGPLFEAMSFDTSYLDRNVYALSLAIGVRAFDLGGCASTDLCRLVEVHNHPDLQDTHCLRAEWQDGEEGDAAAVESCRGVIRREMAAAFDARDPDAREQVEVHLAYQGTRHVPLSGFYYHLGRALHVVEDSFSHCYRTADRTGIVEVMNWIEDVSGRRDLDRDGPAHVDAADDCLCSRPGGQETYDAVLEASTALVALASAPGTRAEREAALEELLEHWMAHVPGCTRDNGYCSSPDPVDLAGDPCPGCNCSAAPGGSGRAAWAAVLALALLAARRRPA